MTFLSYFWPRLCLPAAEVYLILITLVDFSDENSIMYSNFGSGSHPSRYFSAPSIRQVEELNFSVTDREVYLSVATSLAKKCWGEDQSSSHHTRAGENAGIYCGTLGRLSFLRLGLAWYFTALASDTSNEETTQKDIYRRQSEKLLTDGLKETQSVISKLQLRTASRISSSDQSCTLLEGPLIGALALQTVFLHLLSRSPNEDGDVKTSVNELLRVGSRIIIEGKLDKNECEVLYGRCGYLHAILFIRKNLSLPTFGQDIALTIIDQIITTGTRNAASAKIENDDHHDLPLLWVWHGKVYLGACHGISGILYTLLHFWLN
jgi:hypothetical protein